MNFDWQTVAVALIVAGALAYVACRVVRRLRSFSAPKGGAGCATGCGACPEVDAPIRQTSARVRIGSSKTTDRGRN